MRRKQAASEIRSGENQELIVQTEMLYERYNSYHDTSAFSITNRRDFPSCQIALIIEKCHVGSIELTMLIILSTVTSKKTRIVF